MFAYQSMVLLGNHFISLDVIWQLPNAILNESLNAIIFIFSLCEINFVFVFYKRLIILLWRLVINKRCITLETVWWWLTGWREMAFECNRDLWLNLSFGSCLTLFSNGSLLQVTLSLSPFGQVPSKRSEIKI